LIHQALSDWPSTPLLRSARTKRKSGWYDPLMLTLHDLTEEFTSARIDWGLGGKTFRAQFSATASALRTGLYASIYENDSSHAIYDRNGAGRLLVPKNARTFKYGKFENGVAERHKDNHRHLHRRDAEGIEVETDIFASCLRLLLVLDLSPLEIGSDVSVAEVFEPYWNGCIRAFLEERGHLDRGQRDRGESRYLLDAGPSKAALSPLLERLAARIEAAARELFSRRE